MKKIRGLSILLLEYMGILMGLYGVVAFNHFIAPMLLLGLRAIASIVAYWLIAVVPIVMMVVRKESLSDYGFAKGRIARQILIGFLIAVVMSLVLTGLPHLLGFGEYFDSGKRYQYLWQYLYEFGYCILAVGAVEEIVFRGYLYTKIEKIFGSKIVAVVASSVLFGLLHIFSGNILQLFMTTIIGVFYCVCRLKIKDCTLLSLIIAHGVYDVLITVWAVFLL